MLCPLVHACTPQNKKEKGKKKQIQGKKVKKKDNNSADLSIGALKRTNINVIKYCIVIIIVVYIIKG